MKVLNFTDKQLFDNFYNAIMIGERYIQGARLIRLFIKVMDQIDEITDPIILGPDNIRRRLVESGGTLSLEEEEYGLVRETINNVLEKGINALTAQTQQTYRIMDSRSAVKLMDFIENPDTLEIKLGR